MSKRLFIDIETLPPPEEMRASINRALVSKLVSRHRKAQCGDAGVECTDEQFRRLALHAEYGRVLSIGMIVEREGKVVCRGVLGRERGSLRFHLDETKTLRAFWKQLREFDERRDLIIGHNIFEFDLLFLLEVTQLG